MGLSGTTPSAVTSNNNNDASWLLWLCASRMGFATIFTTYSAALPLLKTDWNMTAGQAGMVQSAWHLGFLVSLFTVGFMADHYGAKRTFLLTSVAASASALVFALFSDGFLSALLLHGLAGLCSGGSYTPGLALIAERFRGGGQGRAMGFYLAAASLGYAISLFLSSALILSYGWRGAFVATACGPLAATLIAFRVLRDTPNVVHPVPADHGDRASLLTVIRNRPAMLAIWAYVFHAWELLGLWAWLPAYLAAAMVYGGDITAAAVSAGATLTAVTYLISTVGSVAGGSLSDRWGRTAVILTMSVTSLVCSFLFGWLIGLPLWVVVAVAIVYNFTGTADSSIHSTALSELVPPRFLGAAYSLRSVLGFGAGAISPWIFGLALDWGRGPLNSEGLGWGLAWTTLGLGALLGPVATLALRRSPEAGKLAGGRR